MKSLPIPMYDPKNTFGLCVAEITDSDTIAHYGRNEGAVLATFKEFERASKTSAWHTLSRSAFGNPDQLAVGELSKKQLVDLYSRYMVGAKGAARNVYDALLVSSEEICPFCGGLGHVKSLDHYLPKAYFPAFAVLPANLIPCCRDCNTDKRAESATAASGRTIHPYFDPNCFFDERWIRASIIGEHNPVVVYRSDPPTHWSDEHKSQALQHFNSYNLAHRFGLQAGAEITRVVETRRSSLSCLTEKQYLEHLQDNANASGYDLNGWMRTMYQALIDSGWFLSKVF